MRRSLVLSDEAARHPFLASLPPHIRRETAPIPSRPKWYVSRQDARQFFGAYIATLAVALVFIA